MNPTPPESLFPKTPWPFWLLRWGSISWGKVDSFFAGFLPTQWQRKGGCKKTGACCQLIALELPRFIRYRPLYWLFTHGGRWWNEQINGFTFEGISDERYLVFTCKRLGADNLCMDYKNRPRVCREYPETPLFGRPKLAKGCGFYFSLKPTKTKLYRD